MTEDPHAPLLTKKKSEPMLPEIPEKDQDLFNFVENLSTDDEEIPNDEEIDQLLNEKQD